jgi:hypothetical protein
MSRMWGSSRPYRKAPPRNSAKGLSNVGARDRARTGDPHVGNVFRPLDSAAFSRETAAGSRIGHARVAAMLRGRYALLREQITLEKYALDIGTRKKR